MIFELEGVEKQDEEHIEVRLKPDGKIVSIQVKNSKEGSGWWYLVRLKDGLLELDNGVNVDGIKTTTRGSILVRDITDD